MHCDLLSYIPICYILLKHYAYILPSGDVLKLINDDLRKCDEECLYLPQ